MNIKLNLIPPAKREEIKKNNQLKSIVRLELFLTSIFLIFFTVLVGFKYILNIELAFHSDQQAQNQKETQYETIKRLDDNFGQANALISKVAMVKRDQVYWSAFLDKLNSLVFPGIDVNSVATLDYSVTLLGQSLTRDDLILFKEKLEKEECFSDIDLPLSNLVDKNNIEFQIDFNVKKECLKK